MMVTSPHYIVVWLTTGLLWAACSKSQSSSSPPPPTAPSPPPPSTATLTVTFDENPVPFKNTGCSPAAQQGWYTSARIQETSGVVFTPSSLVQKLDGTPSTLLAESFNSRFGACPGSTFTAGAIAANGAVCGTVGICTASTYRTYQFDVSGNDANGHAVTFSSPVLQLGARPGQ